MDYKGTQGNLEVIMIFIVLIVLVVYTHMCVCVYVYACQNASSSLFKYSVIIYQLYLREWLKWKRLLILDVDEDVGQLELS